MKLTFEADHTVNIYRYGLGMIIGNTFVILVYRYFTYKLCRHVRQIISQMPINHILKYLYNKITKILLIESCLINCLELVQGIS